MQVLQVINQTRSTVIGARITVAATSLRRMRGLLGRSSLGHGEGLWIRPSSGVHTIGMRFVIDVIGLGKEQRVIRLWNNLRPYRVTSVSVSLRSVIELPPGRIAECQVQVGDLFQFNAVQV